MTHDQKEQFTDFIFAEMVKKGFTPDDGLFIPSMLKNRIMEVVNIEQIKRRETPISVLLQEGVS